MKEKVEIILDKLRPYILNDGGDIEFVNFNIFYSTIIFFITFWTY